MSCLINALLHFLPVWLTCWDIEDATQKLLGQTVVYLPSHGHLPSFYLAGTVVSRQQSLANIVFFWREVHFSKLDKYLLLTWNKMWISVKIVKISVWEKGTMPVSKAEAHRALELLEDYYTRYNPFRGLLHQVQSL